MKTKQNILILSPHPDDGGLGCGGTIVKYIQENKKIIYVAFSGKTQEVNSRLPKNVQEGELIKAIQILNIKKNNLIFWDYPIRRFCDYRQSILDNMVLLNQTLKPDLVFLPNQNDTHQDHNVIATEAFRAFKKTSMLGYELPWNSLDFRTCCFSILKEEHVERKINALQEHKSQLNCDYMTKEALKSLMVTRGIQVGKEYAEAFEVIRWIM